MTDTENNESHDKSAEREIVSFRIGEQDFCIDIMNIREIRGFTPATPLPHAPSYIRGLINLRGSVLPIIDLAERLGLGVREPSERDVIIVAMVDKQLVGLVVDGVSDILTVPDSDIQPTPTIGGGDPTGGCVQGVLAIEDRMVRLLDLARVVPEKKHTEAA